ncbi:hypothetical protein Tco_1000773 [Tanacetum coccineum]
MTRQRSQLINFVSKFLGTVRFGNDQIAKITGYGDYQLGNITISRVYYVEGLGHNLFDVGQFCDSYLEVAFQKHTCFVRNLKGAKLLSGSRDINLYTISLDDMLKSSRIWKRKKHSHKPQAEDTNQEKLYLLHMDLCGPMHVKSINGKSISCLSSLIIQEAVSTCYTQNRSLILPLYNKTPYELMHDKKPDLSFLYVFGSLCYPTNDSEDLGKLKPKADIGFVPNPVSPTPYVLPTKNDWDILFQPMFDEFLNPPPSVVSQVPAAATPRPADLTGVEEPLQTAHFDDNPFHEIPHEDITSKQSSSNMQSTIPSFELLGKWIKTHSLANMIGNPSLPVSTRKQLQTDALWCYFDAFLTSVKPKNFKEAMLESSWIEAMQEEIH